MVGDVGVPCFVGSFEKRAFDGVSLALERSNLTVEVFMRHVQVNVPVWEVATEFLHFTNDFIVVVLACFLVEVLL